MFGLEKDRGLGDTLARMNHKYGIDSAAEWVARLMGWPDCGCTDRQIRVNSIFPYKSAKLSVCIPTRDDWYGFWATWHSVASTIIGEGLLESVEIVVLDQGDPQSQCSKLVKNTVDMAARREQMGLVDHKRRVINTGGALRCRYVNRRDILGTAAGKQFSVMHAAGDWCLVIDSHVILESGVLQRLLKWINKKKNRNAKGMYHGVLTDDSYSSAYQYLQTHDPQGKPIIGTDGVFGRWINWEDERCLNRNGKPFVIPAGAGWCFAVNRNWFLSVGYHPLMRGFGGEEGSQALRVRKRGAEVYCHPGLRGVHRFGNLDEDSAKRTYGRTDQEKLRNQVISYLDAEKNLDELRSAELWAKLSQNAVEPTIQATIQEYNNWMDTVEQQKQQIAGNRPVAQPQYQPSNDVRQVVDQMVGMQVVKQSRKEDDLLAGPFSIPVIYERLCKQVSDINEHLPTLKRYAEKCQHVTEFGTRGGVSTTALIAANPERVISYDVVNICGEGCLGCNLGRMPCVLKLKQDAVEVIWMHGVDTAKIESIETTDMLLIDTVHTADQVREELKHADNVRRYIILHDTKTFGQNGEHGKPGILLAVQEFLTDNSDQWKIKEVYENNNGLMVLERVTEEEASNE